MSDFELLYITIGILALLVSFGNLMISIFALIVKGKNLDNKKDRK